MDNFIDNFKKFFSLTGLACLIGGLLLLIYPQSASTWACYILGAIILVQGATTLFAALRLMKRGFGGTFRFVWGLLLIGTGVFFIARTDVIISAIPFIFGFFIFADGLSDISKAIKLKNSNYDKWWISFVLAILQTILGVIMIFNPFSAAVTMLRFIGICLIYAGITTFWTMYQVFKNGEIVEETIFVEGQDVTFSSNPLYTGEYTQEITFTDVIDDDINDEL